jgi:hypothetical protein
MEIEFRGPHCSAVGHADWELGGLLACPHCGHGLAAKSAEAPAQSATKLECCPVCNGYEFYRQRDFNRRLGVALVILGVILAWSTRGLSLLVVALVDLALYALLPRITICYRCEAIFRGLPAGGGGGDFDLSTADKYRRIRAEELADAIESRQREDQP